MLTPREAEIVAELQRGLTEVGKIHEGPIFIAPYQDDLLKTSGIYPYRYPADDEGRKTYFGTLELITGRTILSRTQVVLGDPSGLRPVTPDDLPNLQPSESIEELEAKINALTPEAKAELLGRISGDQS